MKKYSSTLGCGMKQAPMVLGLSVALCMPAAFSYASASEEWVLDPFSLLCKDES